jgi:hypothetical protein
MSAEGVEEATATMYDASQVLSRLKTASEAVQATSQKLRADADAAFSELESDLRDSLRARGWQCDGQWPNFIVQRGVDVKIDEVGRTVQVAGRKVRVASAKATLDVLAAEVEHLIPKGFDSREFVEQIVLAYDALRGDRTTVPILEVYRGYVIARQKPGFWRNAVGGRYEGVSADQFRARLAEAMERGDITVNDGRALRLLPPIDPKDALFVYQPAERRFAFVGRVEFVREG